MFLLAILEEMEKTFDNKKIIATIRLAFLQEFIAIDGIQRFYKSINEKL
jgi:hypothetical protein